MKTNDCYAFQEWLERLPRTELSPAFRQHLEQCPRCARSFRELAPIADLLAAVEPPDPLSVRFVADLSASAIASDYHGRDQRTKTRLILIGVLCLPLLILINGLWAYLGYNFFKAYVSPLSAHIFLVLFLAVTTLISSVSYGLIPLLAAWMSTHVPEESTS